MSTTTPDVRALESQHVLQTYRRFPVVLERGAGMRLYLDRLVDWARATGRTPPLVIRLVKGAYWDHEIVEARQHGWAPPVFEA